MLKENFPQEMSVTVEHLEIQEGLQIGMQVKTFCYDHGVAVFFSSQLIY